ncbi:TPA: DUF4376 domain-containing protein [Escherichia coli]|nr:DUF4376 domain-containing protein [Escherichia coli]
MLHLKNITAGHPKTAEQYQMTKQHGITWLFSEDDKNWYEELKNFASDTIKMVYTGDGRVVWVGKDVTGIEPRNASVIEVPDITANRRITVPGYWFYRDDKFVFDYIYPVVMAAKSDTARTALAWGDADNQQVKLSMPELEDLATAMARAQVNRNDEIYRRQRQMKDVLDGLEDLRSIREMTVSSERVHGE